MPGSDSFTKMEVIDKLRRCEADYYSILAGGAKLPIPVYEKLHEIEAAMRVVRKELWNDYIKNGG